MTRRRVFEGLAIVGAAILAVVVVFLFSWTIDQNRAARAARRAEAAEFEAWCRGTGGRAVWRSGAWNRPDYPECLWPPGTEGSAHAPDPTH